MQLKGCEHGLWTQSNLEPDSNPETPWHLLRDFDAEVKTGGITTLKTDVAWVGSGYSFGLNGIKTAYDTVTTGANKRPNIITLDGWAGTQRFGGIWTGDQYGGNWEYIRFHIPTYIGQSLSGNPNIGSDMDGIFGGDPIISARDYQWKTFTPSMLDMDGWGTYRKSPMTHGDPYTGISRFYLKLKAQLMPYIYTSAASAANIDTGNGDAGLPMIRAMLLSDNSEYAASTSTQYQYMFGENFLVAPVYQDTQADENGNDIRNGIYLPTTAPTRIPPSGSITSRVSSIAAARFSTTTRLRFGAAAVCEGQRYRADVRREQQPRGSERHQHQGYRPQSAYRRVLRHRGRRHLYAVRGRRLLHRKQHD